MPTDYPVSEGDVVEVTYTSSANGEQSFRANVTDTDDDYMNGEDPETGGGFKCRRFADNKEIGVADAGWVTTFGWKQKFIGEDAGVEKVTV